MNGLNKHSAEFCKVVQYADDTQLFCDDNDIKKNYTAVAKNRQKFFLHSTKHSFKLNKSKTELITFSKKLEAETRIQIQYNVK